MALVTGDIASLYPLIFKKRVMLKFPLPIILASTSPRRHELLNQVKVSHAQIGVDIDETILPQENPLDYISRMVAKKAEQAAVLKDLPKECLVITADTIGVLADNTILVKPTDFANACDMWQKMSDTSHQVWTAEQVSHIKHNKIVVKKSALVTTEAQFIALTKQMMLDYWASGEPQDKAGGYAIQGLGASWVKSINGSYSNVVGLPLVETLDLLHHFSF